jgi:hypothetical protein
MNRTQDFQGNKVTWYDTTMVHTCYTPVNPIKFTTPKVNPNVHYRLWVNNDVWM